MLAKGTDGEFLIPWNEMKIKKSGVIFTFNFLDVRSELDVRHKHDYPI